MIDQTQLAEDLSSKIKYEFRQMFLVKPLEPVKVKKKISEPVAKDTKPKKDKDGIEAVDYDDVKSLRLEARQKLKQFQPVSVGQASRISGVSPADISVLLVYLEHFHSTAANQ